MLCPWCRAKLEGLGKFCHTCNRYTDLTTGESPAVQTELLRAPNEQETEHVGRPQDGDGQPEAAPVPPRPAAAVIGPQAASGRQVLVLPLISQNRMWGVRVFIAKDKMIAAALAGDWRGMMKAAHGAMHITHEGAEYKKQAAQWLTAQGALLMEGELKVSATLYLPRRVGDTDNYTKALSDALQGPVVENDKQFAEWHVVRRYDKERPRVVVVIEPADPNVVLDPGAAWCWDEAF